ncbi:MAG: VWA domain-containing protein [Elusimicrobiaceae bacterium]|nr:VWA domain-containing protein [Elusimicrobiaceae bacterium]
MTFGGLYWLLLLIPICVIILFSRMAIYDQHTSIRLSMPPKMRPERCLRVELAGLVPYLLRAAALVLLCLALARPQLVQKKVLPPTAGVDIMLCIDTSSSMQANDFPPNRIEAAKQAALEFIQKRKSDRIGIVVFAVNAMLQCPLTNDYSSLEEFLSQVRIGMTFSDGTAIGDAIATAANHLKNSAAKTKIMVLLTDGRSNSGIITDPVLAAKAAASYGIKIYTIGTASEEATRGARIGMQEDTLDRATLSEIARVTGGEFFHARNRAELERIYDNIDKQEKTEFKNQVSVTYFDKYMYFLLPAILLLFCEFMLVRTLFLRIP